MQWQYNRAFNRNLNNNPFHLTFGIEAPVGLQSTCLPMSQWDITTEMQLFKIIGNNEVQNLQELEEEEEEIEDEVISHDDFEDVVFTADKTSRQKIQ